MLILCILVGCGETVKIGPVTNKVTGAKGVVVSDHARYNGLDNCNEAFVYTKGGNVERWPVPVLSYED